MYQYWQKKSQEEINNRVFRALAENVNYSNQTVLGIPASYLDDKVFQQDAAFLKDAPFMSSLVQNPNHIGCHTLGKSESFFKGTQALEKELIDLCAVDILQGEPEGQDGYLASGGTEANIQAIWLYRNLFMRKHGAHRDEICILCSEDSHYSMDKAANLLALDIYKVCVEGSIREITGEQVKATVERCQLDGKKFFIVVCNMMTTMFGSIDNVEAYTGCLEELACHYKIHVDGAYGGFYYPFTNKKSRLSFKNKHISSFTLDAHKMAQAPYGTGIFLVRKGMLQYVKTQQASYVEGEDSTLIGSRSGANAVAVWMILMKNGPYGWQEKVYILQKRTEWVCQQLDGMDVDYYRHPKSNIITIDSRFISVDLAQAFGLVPDNHANPSWYKIVIMEHVTIDKLARLVQGINEQSAEVLNSC